MAEKAQVAKLPVEVVNRQTSVEVFHLLTEPLPVEALKAEDSRGVTLTTINQAFVMERLQEVFGLVGYGWRYAFGPHWREVAEKGEEILVEVALQWRVTDDPDCRAYSPPVYWLKQWDPQTAALTEGWEFGPGPAVWSEPIFAKGGSSTNRRGNTRLTDAHRSAETSALSKAAARLGIGQEVYKDEDEVSLAMNGNNAQGGNRPRGQGRRQSGDSPHSTHQASSKPARAPKAGTGYVDIESIQAGAQVYVGKLNIDAALEPQAKVLEQLATKMETVGLKMQPMRLIHALLGVGGFTQKGVIGVYNFLVEGHLSEANIELLNQVAFQ